MQGAKVPIIIYCTEHVSAMIASRPYFWLFSDIFYLFAQFCSRYNAFSIKYISKYCLSQSTRTV